jgi:methionyl aminopeptidase
MIARADETEDLVEAGKRLGEVLEKLAAALRPGVSTLEIDTLAEKLIRAGGDEPSLKGYRPEGAQRPYPAALCISVNEEVVHGIPSASHFIKEGDIVGLDLCLTHKGYVMDSALTVPVGKISKEARELMAVTQEALYHAIKKARPGNHIGDISNAIEKAFKGTGFSIVKALGGHAVGGSVHEEPFIPNVGTAGTGPEIKVGMVLAIEPISNAGKASVVIMPDGYTYRSKDGTLSAHFEHSVLVGEKVTTVLTRRPSEQL